MTRKNYWTILRNRGVKKAMLPMKPYGTPKGVRDGLFQIVTCLKFSPKLFFTTVCQSVLHPDTQEIINPLFRMSMFLPMNVPICAGMILSAPTVSSKML